MPDFDDIPDLPAHPVDEHETLALDPLLRPYGPSLSRLEAKRRKRLAIAVSFSWLAVQLAAFGGRDDFSRLPGSYIFLLMVAPIAAGCSAVALASYGGKLSLGGSIATVRVLAVLAPLSFVLLGLALPSPYVGGQAGNLSLGASCLDSTLVWALLPVAAAGIALRGTFAAGAEWRSALLGGGCGLIAAGLFTLRCPIVGNLHVAFAHGGAVLLSTCVGGLSLARITRT